MYVSAINQINPTVLNQKISSPCKSKSFRAMSLGKQHPMVTPKIRQLAETATDIMEGLEGKNSFKTLISDVTAVYKVPDIRIEPKSLTLSKKINEKDISVKMHIYPQYGTYMHMHIHDNNDTIHGGTYFTYCSNKCYENEEYFIISERAWMVPIERSLTSKDVQTFERYLGEMLADADKIKNAV
ncbi:MAG: hypothetical protein MJ230_00560 [bacterium]|nr:hypothetical protein [bacterium]